jgi:hypothetical protein
MCRTQCSCNGEIENKEEIKTIRRKNKKKVWNKGGRREGDKRMAVFCY